MQRTLPFDFLDKVCFAATDAAQGTSNAPTWELVLDGHLPEPALREALRLLALRFPVVTATVAPEEGDRERAKRWSWVLRDAAIPLEVVALTDAAALTELRHQLCDRFVDLTQEGGLQVVLATLPEGQRLFVKQHHGLADGRAMLTLLTELAGFIRAAERGEAVAVAAPYPRRAELEALALSPWERRRLFVGGIWEYLRGLWAGIRLPVSELRQNRSLDYTGGNRTLHLTRPSQLLDEQAATAKAAGGNLNTLIIAWLFEANRRWHTTLGDHPQRVNMTLIAETRPRSGFDSFANHLTSFIIDLRLDQVGDTRALMLAAHQQLRAQAARRAQLRRYLVERWMVLALRMGDLRKMLFSAGPTVINLNLSNMLAIPIPTIAGDGWRVTAALISTPTTPRTGIVLTVTRCEGVVTFNFNYKTTVVSQGEVEQLVAQFAGLLDSDSGGL
jgi:NRPS condensation-like uncharacterized protein